MRVVSVVTEVFQVLLLGCTLLMKKNSENAHHFIIGAADI